MARPLRIQYPHAYYHVTCRGNDRKEIFRDDSDRVNFLDGLSRSLESFNVILLAYACMPNHFHLLVQTPEGNLSEFMRHFNIVYTSAFNRRHKRTGHLYQGRYKAFLIDADNYLMEVARYIHLNPLRMRSSIPLEERWERLLKSDDTSLPGYISKNVRKAFVHYGSVLDYLGRDTPKGRRAYANFIREGLVKTLESPLNSGRGHGIVGSLDFISQIRETMEPERGSLREQPAFRKLSRTCTPEELINHFSKRVGVDRSDLCSRGRHSFERALLMELLYKLCRMTQSEIGKLVGGIDYSAVSQARKRLRTLLDHNAVWREKYEMVLQDLGEMSRIKI